MPRNHRIGKAYLNRTEAILSTKYDRKEKENIHTTDKKDHLNNNDVLKSIQKEMIIIANFEKILL